MKKPMTQKQAEPPAVKAPEAEPVVIEPQAVLDMIKPAKVATVKENNGDLTGDPYGCLYYTDEAAHRVFKLDPNGQKSLLAGTGTPGFSGDGGLGIHAQLSSPTSIHYTPNGLYVLDSGNARIRRIDRHGVITTIASLE